MMSKENYNIDNFNKHFLIKIKTTTTTQQPTGTTIL